MSTHANFRSTAALLALVLTSALSAQQTAPRPRGLHLVQIGSDSAAFYVTATLIAGPTESILWDAQYFAPDAARLADAVQASGTRLKAILLSHIDEDHVSGLGTLLQRFPGTPVYISPAGVAAWNRARATFQRDKAGPNGPRLPDSLPTPAAFPAAQFTVDGQPVEVLADLTGDTGRPANSALWIPSLRTVLTGDILFNGVHLWLGGADSTARVAWQASLDRLAALEPEQVVSGHKRVITLPDAPALIQENKRYLEDFEQLRNVATSPKDLRARMEAKHPDMVLSALMAAGTVPAMRGRMPAEPTLEPPAAGSNTPLKPGEWIGTITTASGDELPFRMIVGWAAEKNTLTINMPDGTPMPVDDVRFDGKAFSFVFTGPGVLCVLNRQPDGGLSGRCAAQGNTMGTINVKPPAQ